VVDPVYPFQMVQEALTLVQGPGVPQDAVIVLVEEAVVGVVVVLQGSHCDVDGG